MEPCAQSVNMSGPCVMCGGRAERMHRLLLRRGSFSPSCCPVCASKPGFRGGHTTGSRDPRRRTLTNRKKRRLDSRCTASAAGPKPRPAMCNMAEEADVPSTLHTFSILHHQTPTNVCMADDSDYLIVSDNRQLFDAVGNHCRPGLEHLKVRGYGNDVSRHDRVNRNTC